jgi:hypothetical protein
LRATSATAIKAPTLEPKKAEIFGLTFHCFSDPQQEESHFYLVGPNHAEGDTSSESRVFVLFCFYICAQGISFYNNTMANNRDTNTDSNQMIPEPDYNEDDRPGRNNRNNNNDNNNENLAHRLEGNPTVLLDKDGLVVPRKPANPCTESTERRDLHRELQFHQKTGINVLNQKSELQKALQKHRDHQSRKELEQERQSSRSALEKTLEERARRLETLEKGLIPDESQNTGEPNEFLRMHAKLRGRVGALP